MRDDKNKKKEIKMIKKEKKEIIEIIYIKKEILNKTKNFQKN